MRRITLILTIFFISVLSANAQSDYYWVNGEGGWMDSTEVNNTWVMTHWAKDAAGTTPYTTAEFVSFQLNSQGSPRYLTNEMTGTVYFGSFSDLERNDTIQLDMFNNTDLKIHGWDASALEDTVFFNNPYNNVVCTFYSSVTFSPFMVLTQTSDLEVSSLATWQSFTFDLEGAGDVTFDPAGMLMADFDAGEGIEIYVEAAGNSGTLHLLDSLNAIRLDLDGGIVDFNGQPIAVEDFNVIDLSAYSSPIDLGSSSFHINGFSIDFHTGFPGWVDGSKAQFYIEGEAISDIALGIGNQFGFMLVRSNNPRDALKPYGSEIDSLYIGGEYLKIGRNNNDTLVVNNLIVEAGVNISVPAISGNTAANITVGESLVIKGEAGRPVFLSSATAGSQAVITADADVVIDVDYLSVQDISVIGGGDFTVAHAYDRGNNSGWNFTSAITSDEYHWVGGSSDSFTDAANWATSSGGQDLHFSPPQDSSELYFHANSLDAEATLHIMEDVTFKSIDLSGLDETLTLETAGENTTWIVAGDVTLSTRLSLDTLNLAVVEDGNTTLTSTSNSWSLVDNYGTLNLADDQNMVSLTNSTNAILNTNGYTIAAAKIDLNGEAELSTSEVVCTYWGCNISTNLSAQDARITVNEDRADEIAFEPRFLGGGQAYGDVTMAVFSREIWNLSGANTFRNLTIEAGSALIGFRASVQTVTGSFQADGTLDAFTYLENFKLSMQSEDAAVEFAEMKDVEADVSTGYQYTADQSFDLGGNTDWTFTNTITNDYYWVGGSSDDFIDKDNWSGASGGMADKPFAPNGPEANVYFDANSFGADGAVIYLTEDVAVKKIICDGVDQLVTLDGTDGTLYAYDTVWLEDNLMHQNLKLEFADSPPAGPDFYVIRPNSSYFDEVEISSGQGTQDTLSLAEALFAKTISGAYTLLTNDFGVTLDYLNSNNQVKVWDVGASIITVKERWDAEGDPNATNNDLQIVSDATPTFRFSNPGGTFELNGNNQDYGNASFEADTVWMYGSSAFETLEVSNTSVIMVEGDFTGPETAFSGDGAEWVLFGNDVSFEGKAYTYDHVHITGKGNLIGANTLDTLSASAGGIIVFEAGETHDIGLFSVSGNVLDTVYLRSSSSGAAAELSFDEAPYVSYASIRDLTASRPGGELSTAYFSKDAGGNTGWEFLEPEVAVRIGFSPNGGPLDGNNPQLSIQFDREVALGIGELAYFRVSDGKKTRIAANQALILETEAVFPIENIPETGTYYVTYDAGIVIDAETGAGVAALANINTWRFEVPVAEVVTFSPNGTTIDAGVSNELKILFDREVNVGSGQLTIYDENDVEAVTFSVGEGTVQQNELMFELAAESLSAGSYYVLYDDGIVLDAEFGGAVLGLHDPSKWIFDVEIPLSISANQSLIAYPNPTSGNIVLNLEGLDVLEIQLINTSGQLLETIEGNSVDLSSYEDGVYFIKIIMKEKEVTQRVIKKTEE